MYVAYATRSCMFLLWTSLSANAGRMRSAMGLPYLAVGVADRDHLESYGCLGHRRWASASSVGP